MALLIHPHNAHRVRVGNVPRSFRICAICAPHGFYNHSLHFFSRILKLFSTLSSNAQ